MSRPWALSLILVSLLFGCGGEGSVPAGTPAGAPSGDAVAAPGGAEGAGGTGGEEQGGGPEAVDSLSGPSAQDDGSSGSDHVSSADTGGIEPDPPNGNEARFPKPDHLRGIYLNAWTAGSWGRRGRLIELAKRTEVNAFVIDIKDASGHVSHPTRVPLAQDVGATEEIRIRDLGALLLGGLKCPQLRQAAGPRSYHCYPCCHVLLPIRFFMPRDREPTAVRNSRPTLPELEGLATARGRGPGALESVVREGSYGPGMAGSAGSRERALGSEMPSAQRHPNGRC